MKKLLVISLAFLVLGCSPKSVDDYNTGDNEEQITKLLNERQYGKAVFVIESKHGKRPADKNVAFLLGQAYLGKAGFEPLLVASKVSDVQSFSSREARLLFPDCASGRVKHVKGAEVLCLLKRIYLHVPDADVEEFTRARELFRHAYPDPAGSPEWVNILVGMVETASVVKRVGAIYVFVLKLAETRDEPTEAELEWFVRQVKRTVAESDQALKRADHSGKAISQFLTGSKEAELFDKARQAISWANMLGLPALFDIYRSQVIKPEEETRYGDTLDKIRKLLDTQTEAVRALR